MTLLHSLDNLPGPATSIEGDIKTVVSYELQDEKIQKVSGRGGGGRTRPGRACYESKDAVYVLIL